MNIAAMTSERTTSKLLPPIAVVCVGRGERGRRHDVHRLHGGIEAFLCGRWRSESQVVQMEGGRRHAHMCHTCYQAWKRRNKEQAT